MKVDHADSRASEPAPSRDLHRNVEGADSEGAAVASSEDERAAALEVAQLLLDSLAVERAARLIVPECIYCADSAGRSLGEIAQQGNGRAWLEWAIRHRSALIAYGMPKEVLDAVSLLRREGYPLPPNIEPLVREVIGRSEAWAGLHKITKSLFRRM